MYCAMSMRCKSPASLDVAGSSFCIIPLQSAAVWQVHICLEAAKSMDQKAHASCSVDTGFGFLKLRSHVLRYILRGSYLIVFNLHI